MTTTFHVEEWKDWKCVSITFSPDYDKRVRKGLLAIGGKYGLSSSRGPGMVIEGKTVDEVEEIIKKLSEN
jgi:dissimilatory sulfite reductase (desulfoviridin) alpha/beta subunit